MPQCFYMAPYHLINVYKDATNTNIVFLQTMERETEFMKSVDSFMKSKDEPNSILNIARESSPVVKEALDKQFATFKDDMKKLEQGKMSYSEMRKLYG